MLTSPLHNVVCVTAQVAVFGFCDIRRFTDTTEVLQEGVMEFVNVIAHLVHTAVAVRGGAANKNIGDAFLLVRGGCIDQRPLLTDQSWRVCRVDTGCNLRHAGHPAGSLCG